MKQALVAIALVAGMVSATATFGQFETRTTAAGGVTVKVTPNQLSADVATWEFAVVFDTHTQDLSDDVAKVAAIVDASGVRRSPIAWVGAAAGGHHREGVLRFSAIKPHPAAIELQINRAGESTPRSFRWKLK